MLKSMTGFASRKGASDGYSWAWEVRAVNARGLDLRFRVPDWIDGLEQSLRGIAAKRLARGNVSVNLRLQRDESDGGATLNPARLTAVLATLRQTEHEAEALGLELAPTSAADILSMRGVLEQAEPESENGELRKFLTTEFESVLDAFDEMRIREGGALETVLARQLDEVSTLCAAAAEAAEARRDKIVENLKTNLARVLDNAEADPDRVAQELALLAVKSDVTEELDRLDAHIAAARELITAKGPSGRKLDFLMQEFNREANTLCSKAGSPDLTRIGLDLKAVIDQMREQVQNVE